MTHYVDSTEQLVTEILVLDMRRSVDFYRGLGFELLRDGGDFVELTWEQHRLFLAEPSAFHVEGAVSPVPPAFPLANVRVMVPDVDRYWRLAHEIGAEVAVPIGDRYSAPRFHDPRPRRLRCPLRQPPWGGGSLISPCRRSAVASRARRQAGEKGSTDRGEQR